jgi:mannose/fructose/N-acetylgalactosamine-specific phosphotransferase system component IID
MVYTAFSLAILGFAVGAVFRFKILLLMVALLLVFSIAFSLARGTNFLDSALTIMAAQAILQGSYFLGLVARAFFTATIASVAQSDLLGRRFSGR